MRSLIVLVALFACCFSLRTTWRDLHSYNFEKYVEEFGKKYSSSVEYGARKEIFANNLAEILSHNSRPSTYKKGVNHLTDLTEEEFGQMLGYKRQNYTSKNLLPHQPSVKNAVAASNVDWRDAGIISDVKDQGQCGSCWTFGTAESVESAYAQKNGQLHVLSEQQILDCTPNPNNCGGSGGCNGGITDIAYDQIVSQGGLSSEWTYPYISYFGQGYTCHYAATKTRPVAVLKGFSKLPSNQYQPVVDYLANSGPLAINVDASNWRFYETGVFTGCNLMVIDINHVVQLVGYGTDAAHGDYWLVRNSWSPSYGEDGYIRIARSSTAPCGNDPTPQDGTGCDNGPAEVTTCGECGILYDTSYPVVA